MSKKKKSTVVSDEETISMTSEEQSATTSYEARSVEQAREEKKEKRRKSLPRELIRFVFVGVLCTLIDFGVQMLLLWAFESNISLIEGWGSYLSFAIAVTIAFLVSNLVNFFCSRFIVFKNVDEKADTKSGKAFLIYLLLGAGGWIIGIGLQELGVWMCQDIWNIPNLSLDIIHAFDNVLADGIGVAFWAFVAIFCIKTIVTMIYNYITRKLIIFRAPKKEEEYRTVDISDLEEKPEEKVEEVHEEVTPVETPEKVREPLVTRASFQTIFKEELDRLFGPGKKRVDVGGGWKIVYEELDRFDKEHPDFVKKGKDE